MRALYTCSVFVCGHVRMGSVCVCVVIMVPDWGGAVSVGGGAMGLQAGGL